MNQPAAFNESSSSNADPSVSPYRDAASSNKNESRIPMLLSILTHTVLVGICLFCFWLFQKPPAETARRGGIVLTNTVDDDNEEYLTEEDVSEDSATQAAAQASSAASSSAPKIEQPVIESAPGPPPIDFDADASSMANDSQTKGLERQFELTQADLDMIAEDQKRFKARQPKGFETSISVFGDTTMTGRKFVFVIDRSQSMGTDGLGVIRAARDELSRAVSELKENHEFQIVAYHDRTVTISVRQMLPATDENKRRVKPFMENLVALGSTEHRYGLVAALAFKPDAIVFMTDGGYPGLNHGEIKEIRRMAGSTQIHCIQFGSGPLQQSTNFMKQLAEQNDGSFSYIDVNHWGEEE
jgi:hypothetical protein